MRAITLLSLALLLAFPPIASAQTDFSTLKLGVGDPIYVTRVSGEKTHGAITQVSASQLTLDSGATVTLDDVLKIDRRGDSLKNGATIGALILGGWCAAVCGQGVSSDDHLVLAVAMNAALGAALGAFIDHDHVGRTTIFQRSTAFRVSPVITSNQRGVTVSLLF